MTDRPTTRSGTAGTGADCRIVGIVQARMGSARLPGKVLRPLAGRSVLGRVVRAARDSGVLADLVVATSTDPVDDAVAAECARLDVACHRGPVDDVLTRFVGALDAHPGDAVMRFTADCPLLDPEIVALVATVYWAVPGLDYASTSIARTLPRGLDVEIVRADALRTLDRLATGHHRVHVTSYAYARPELFRVLGVTLTPDRSDLRLTLDTEQDWALLRAVTDHFGDVSVPLAKLADWLDGQPGLRALNAGVRQKRLEES
ncbi:spore coat polysaccharide biosynthesis protein SpsF [Micromonospora nigra]|uniref:Spore coat polysaccharide biosynthesis protein SpsF n=1 Tax=Micromonospora nigra TaxID=145857 RepID=A0A1C6SSG8_9ACTN|nr:glycosyltransferase family protein [Micromonospora nigra]SCL32526.1 spore coat polysaccharide biosynthesis protein SpsF [Micromonospora nigra]